MVQEPYIAFFMVASNTQYILHSLTETNSWRTAVNFCIYQYIFGKFYMVASNTQFFYMITGQKKNITQSEP